MENLQKLVMYFVASSPRVGRVGLMKLIYLFEYYHTLGYGVPFTLAEFVRYHYGPFAQDVYVAIEMASDIILEDMYISSYGRPAYSYEVAATCVREILEELPDRQRELADFVLECTRGKSFDELLAYVYRTPPMVRIKLVETADHQMHLKEVLDMTARKPILSFSRAELDAARERNGQRRKRGSDEEYFADLISEHKAFSKLRERANQCLTPTSR